MFAFEHPEHFRALAIPNIVAKMPPEQRRALDAALEAQKQAIVAAQEAGTFAKIPIDELMLAASALTHGLAHMIVEGALGELDAARVRELAIAATGVFGVGLIPRTGELRPDPLRHKK